MIAQQVERPVEARIAEVRFLLVPLADIFGKALPVISLTGNNYRTGQCALQKPESARMMLADSMPAFQAGWMGSNPITCSDLRKENKSPIRRFCRFVVFRKF